MLRNLVSNNFIKRHSLHVFKNGTKLNFTPKMNFHSSRVLRDWHQKFDPMTKKFYYYNIFTEEKTDIQPREYLPYDAKPESRMMKFFRTDSFAPTSGKYPSWSYWAMVGGIVAFLSFLDFLYPNFFDAPEIVNGVDISQLSGEERLKEEEIQRRIAAYKKAQAEKYR